MPQPLTSTFQLETTFQHLLEKGGVKWDRDTMIGGLDVAYEKMVDLKPLRRVEYQSTPGDWAELVEKLKYICKKAENPSAKAPPQPAGPAVGPNNPLKLFPDVCMVLFPLSKI